METFWRKFVEVATVLSFISCVWLFPAPEAKWALGGAAAATLVCILLYEVLLTRKDRELFRLHQQATQVISEKDANITTLTAELERASDPELMAIYREDECERLRIRRDCMEQASRDAQRSSEFLDEFTRKQFGMS